MKWEHEIHLDASPHDAWALVADLDRIPAIVPYLTRVTPLEGAMPLGEGSRLALTFGDDGRNLDVEVEVVSWRPQESLGARGVLQQVAVTAEVEWRLTAASGGTRLVQTIELSFDSLAAKFGARALSRRVERELVAGLERFKSALESSPTGVTAGDRGRNL